MSRPARVRQLALGATLVVALIAPALSHGFPDWSAPYSADDDRGCATGAWVDPVGVVFNGDQAYAWNVRRAIEVHLGWTNGSGGDQDLLVKTTSSGSYGCQPFDEQRADGGSSDRNHIRIWRIPASSGSTKKVAGTPHHEDWVWTCPGHAVDANGPNGSGFDRGRNRVKNGFADAGHSIEINEWGNTRNFQQCDGDWAGSSGKGIVIGMGHQH